MATRTHARQAVLGILYAAELGNKNALQNAPSLLDEQKIRNKQQEFALKLLEMVEQNIPKIDFILSKNLSRELSNVGKIEHCILRLSIAEMLAGEQKAVVINEAIEMAKTYADHNSWSLINGVLDSVAKGDFEAMSADFEIFKQKSKPKKPKISESKFSKGKKTIKTSPKQAKPKISESKKTIRLMHNTNQTKPLEISESSTKKEK